MFNKLHTKTLLGRCCVASMMAKNGRGMISCNIQHRNYSSSHYNPTNTKELVALFRTAKDMKEMRRCISTLEHCVEQKPSIIKPSATVIPYTIALEMAIKEKRVDDVRRIYEAMKPHFQMIGKLLLYEWNSSTISKTFSLYEI